MFRETLQTLACLSVLAGTYSLHMARDSYRRPLDDLDVLDITDNTPQLLKQHSPEKDEQQENDISIGHINLHHSEPPRELQELFGRSSPLDIRLQQQPQEYSQQSQNQQQHQNQIKRGSTGNSGGNSVSTSSGTQNLPAVPHGMASQLMLRSARGQRQYDVPQIGE